MFREKWTKNPADIIPMYFGVMAFRALSSEWQQIVTEDLSRRQEYDPAQVILSLKKALKNSLSFRSILKFRILKSGNTKALICFTLFSRHFPEAQGIEIAGEIGGGLQIIHRNCIVNTKRAGRNLSVGPFAVIGESHGAAPEIGDNVKVCANATVIGGIRIGDGAVIGAAAFVNHDVAPGAVVYGSRSAGIREKPDRAAVA